MWRIGVKAAAREVKFSGSNSLQKSIFFDSNRCIHHLPPRFASQHDYYRESQNLSQLGGQDRGFSGLAQFLNQDFDNLRSFSENTNRYRVRDCYGELYQEVEFSEQNPNCSLSYAGNRYKKNTVGKLIANSRKFEQQHLDGYYVGYVQPSANVHNSAIEDYSGNIHQVQQPGANGSITEPQAKSSSLQVKAAVEELGKLAKEGTCMDLLTHLELIHACKEMWGTSQNANDVHTNLMRSVNHSCERILDIYIESGSTSDAYEIFENMPEHSLKSWGTMIMALAKNGLGEDAIDLFNQFKQTGLQPDAHMFMGLFVASSVLCDIEEGMLHFESMRKDYGIIPTMEHYVAVVNMLGSTGYLDEAMEFTEKMPFKPNVDIWERLMNLCSNHGNVALEDHCAKMVHHLDPCRLLTDIAKEKGKKMKSSERSAYLPEDTSQFEDDNEAPALLRGVVVHMKELGYVPLTELACSDIDEESKEDVLHDHLVKLLVAWGLMRTPPRGALHMTKVPLVCQDCHNALQMISQLAGRKILVLTEKNNRIHCFKNGSCPCNDFGDRQGVSDALPIFLILQNSVVK